MELLAVYTTVANEHQAQAIASAAIERGLAACVQAEPIVSTYRWQGSVQREPEVRLMLKTTRSAYAQLQQLLLDMHPYELPAIFAVPVTDATPAYADWVAGSVGAAGSDAGRTPP